MSSTHLADTAAAESLFAPLAREPLEIAAFAYLGDDRRLLGLRHTPGAWRDRIDLTIRDIAADAIAFDARGVVMAHNHPSGDATPSAEDKRATRLLDHALGTLQVRLLDHLVFARAGVTSFRRLGLL